MPMEDGGNKPAAGDFRPEKFFGRILCTASSEEKTAASF
jgi:hypothetical protein